MENKDLLAAFFEYQQEIYKYDKKLERKLWSPIEETTLLKELLANLTLKDLNEIRQQLRLKGLSALKKPELREALVKGIVSKAKDNFALLDKEQYRLIEDLVKNQGILYKFDLDLPQVDYFRTKGLVFSGMIKGQKALIMPQELILVFKELDQPRYKKIINQNTEWVRLTQGLLFYYGALKSEEICRLIEGLTGKELDDWQFLQALWEASEYYGEVVLDISTWSHYMAFDPQWVLKEQGAREDINYYPFSYDQLYKAGASGYIDRNYAFNEFLKFLKEFYDMPDEEAEDIIEDCVYAIQRGETFGEIFDYLQSQFEIDSSEMAQHFGDQLKFLWNNTRQWILKGYTPTELSKPATKSPMGKVLNFPSNLSAGRNEQCPCGSGKKYKKCCGKLIDK